MTDGEFPFRNFTVRAEGYDRGEVDGLVDQLQGEIGELRRALETATPESDASGDARLHDPEGAVTRTLAIAQETADRVLHDAQVEADRRRSEADEQAAATIADADSRAAKMMADIETQTAEVRAQGIAAARSAIQVERDKAVAELGQIRRVRDDIRAEAVELKSTLERYARQATEASEILGAAATGPLLASELPDFVADDIALAGVLDEGETTVEETADVTELSASQSSLSSEPEPMAAPVEDDSWLDEDTTPVSEPAPLAAVADDTSSDTLVWGDDAGAATEAVAVADMSDADIDDSWLDAEDDAPLADVIAIDGDGGDYDELPSDLDAPASGSSGAFLAEVQAAADDTVTLPPESEGSDDSDRFLSELRGVTESVDIDSVDLDSEAADRFFDGD